MPEFVYHIKPANFKGTSILPLSQLEEEYPAIYKREVAKYGKARMKELDEPIKSLKCKWRDVVNLSTVNPVNILSVAELLGNDTDPATIWKIPVSRLKGLDFVLWTDPKDRDKYQPMTISEYRECTTIPEGTIEHFLKSSKGDKKPLVFEHIPHILVAGAVDISGAETIKYSPKNLFSLASSYCQIANQF